MFEVGGSMQCVTGVEGDGIIGGEGELQLGPVPTLPR